MNWIQTKTNLLRTFPLDGRYLIGVSGGRDSVALLHWLVNLGYQKLVVCHLNHQLRGRSSLADARFVEKHRHGTYRADIRTRVGERSRLRHKTEDVDRNRSARLPLLILRESRTSVAAAILFFSDITLMTWSKLS